LTLVGNETTRQRNPLLSKRVAQRRHPRFKRLTHIRMRRYKPSANIVLLGTEMHLEWTQLGWIQVKHNLLITIAQHRHELLSQHTPELLHVPIRLQYSHDLRSWGYRMHGIPH
jgi:hypothetical protein